MATFIVPVEDDRGIYSFHPGVRKVPFANWLWENPEPELVVVGPLQGWDGWEYVISVKSGWYGGTYFVGRSKPDQDVWPEPLHRALTDAGEI